MLYYVLAFTIILLGAAGTVWIGMSKQVREGNPEYDRKSKLILIRLSAYYVVATIAAIAGIIIYLNV